ncbi:DUF7351 domain-containing protein [Halosimplex pelagicum]|uniref:PQQ-binding-like beta-propeller repeat protein n=1 Tax=Halosimplex pelagicum TaxID=869886 RepID=A0A7D5PBS2_9EURY|nr:PQQ-binding-like beta-propeller repeat protein [Halosimplex pelagicum]QLH81878.1 PQQ-binding-like beta-propeller repeat protein [Halosimplex pelagicum]
MVAEWDEERTLEAAVAAFESLTDETRQAAVEELYDLTWDADSGATFTELREAVGVRDPGRFHYHVEKLAETFVRKRDEEYWPLEGRLRAAVAFAACHRSPPVEGDVPTEWVRWSAATRYECPFCERFLAAVGTERESLDLLCAEHGTVFRQVLAPGPDAADPQVWFDAAVRAYHQDAETLREGRCPWCHDSVETTLRYGRLSYTSDAVDAVPWPSLWGRYDCTACPHETWRPLAVALSTNGRVRRFFHARGIDLRREPTPRRYVADAEAVDGDADGPGPERATLTYRVGDATLSLTVDEGVAVESVEPNSQAGSRPDRTPTPESRGVGTDEERTVYDPDSAIYAAPIVTDETVCVVTDRGGCLAFDAETGERRWHVDVDGAKRSPAAADGVVYVGDRRGTVTAVDERTGGQLWSTTADGHPRLAPAVADGTVFLATPDGAALALDAETGEPRWRIDGDGARGGPRGPAIGEEFVFVGGRECVRAIDATTGTPAWTAETDALVTDLATTGETVYVGTRDGVVAVDATDGERRWRTDADAGGVGLAPFEDDLICTAVESGLSRYDGATGRRRWRADVTGDPALRPPTVAGDRVVCSDRSGTLVAVDAAAGERLWSADPVAPHQVSCRPAARGDALYLADLAGRVAAVDADTGETGWRTPLRER